MYEARNLKSMNRPARLSLLCGHIGLWLAISVAACAQPAVPLVRVGILVHQTSVAVGGAGQFVVSSGSQEWQGDSQAWTIALPGATSAAANEARPPATDVYLVDGAGVGHWCSLPVRVRSAGGSQEVWAGKDARSAYRYEGELEIRRDAAGTLAVVNIVDLEAYARGSICAEMDAHYPPEALKAQAVVTRSEALAKAGRHRADGFDSCAESHCQVYHGLRDQAPAGNAAVAATRGELLMYAGKPVDAVYHAACGGHTEDASDVWGGADVPYLRGVPDREGRDRPDAGYRADDQKLRDYLTGAPAVNCRQPEYLNLTYFRWVRVLTPEKIRQSLADSVSVGQVLDLKPLQRGVSGRIMRLEIRGTQAATVISPEYVIRRALGGLPSSAFVVDRYCDEAGKPVVFVLWGAGWGHGVGMCQAGAAGMAKSGHTYREILAKYYTGAEIRVAY
jgi:SpoIID/LytB domain protein